jgi:hypothetical protein
MKIIVPCMAMLAVGCVSSADAELPKLAENREQPVLALFEHALTDHFAGGGNATTCASFAPTPLTEAQEGALLSRLARLAPASRCESGDAVVQVYDFTCRDADVCSGWVARPGAPAARYAMRFEGGVWRFDRDLRVIAE